jgi:hypothetical protein
VDVTDIRTGNMPSCVIWASRMSEVTGVTVVLLSSADKQSVAVVVIKVQPALPNAP